MNFFKLAGLHYNFSMYPLETTEVPSDWGSLTYITLFSLAVCVYFEVHSQVCI